MDSVSTPIRNNFDNLESKIRLHAKIIGGVATPRYKRCEHIDSQQ
jgi:hypothetical protein